VADLRKLDARAIAERAVASYRDRQARRADLAAPRDRPARPRATRWI
jgi:hypothetical protein